MEVYETNLDLKSYKIEEKNESNTSSGKDTILCVHCKRTALNGIRCMGICVADSDY